jgi:hypothetical protein
MRNVSKRLTEFQNINFSLTTFSIRSCRLWDNVGKYGTAVEGTNDNVTERTRFACWITKATDKHSEYLIFIAFPQSQWPSGLRRGSAADRLLGLQVRFPPRAWMFVCCKCCVCCQVEVSATSRSLVQRSPTDCGVSLCAMKCYNPLHLP